MDPSAHLAQKVLSRKEEMVAALGRPEFYAEVMVIAFAVALAWLLAVFVRKRVARHLQAHPPQRIDAEFITKPLALITPLLTLVYLIIARPFAEEYIASSAWITPAIQVSFAYLLAQSVLLIVHSRLVAWFIAIVIMAIAVLDAIGLMHSTVAYLHDTEFSVGQIKLSLLNLTHGIIILVVVFWIAGLMSRTLESYLRRSSSLSYNARELTVKFFRLFVYFLAFTITLSAANVDLTAFAVFGGALGVGVGLGLQKIMANFISGITLLLEKSIQIGDLVEVGGNTGWVRQLNVRYALIETADGREILIPNEELISTRVTNWTHTTNKARIDIDICVAYDSEPAKVRELMLAAAREHPRCLKNPEPACYLREFGPNGLNFLLVFWIPDVRDGRFGPQSEVMMSILDKFAKAGISIPLTQAPQAFKLPVR